MIYRRLPTWLARAANLPPIYFQAGLRRTLTIPFEINRQETFHPCSTLHAPTLLSIRHFSLYGNINLIIGRPLKLLLRLSSFTSAFNIDIANDRQAGKVTADVRWKIISTSPCVLLPSPVWKRVDVSVLSEVNNSCRIRDSDSDRSSENNFLGVLVSTPKPLETQEHKKLPTYSFYGDTVARNRVDRWHSKSKSTCTSIQQQYFCSL